MRDGRVSTAGSVQCGSHRFVKQDTSGGVPKSHGRWTYGDIAAVKAGHNCTQIHNTIKVQGIETMNTVQVL